MKENLKAFFRWYRDMIAAIVLLLIFGVFLLSSQNIRVLLAASSGVTAKFFPIVICTFGIVISIINVISGLSKGNKIREKELSEGGYQNSRTKEEINASLKVVLTIALIIVYLVLTKFIGFVLASTMYLFCQICLLTEKKGRKLVLYGVIAVVVSVVCYLFFRNVFNLMLPKGIMPF